MRFSAEVTTDATGLPNPARPADVPVFEVDSAECFFARRLGGQA